MNTKLKVTHGLILLFAQCFILCGNLALFDHKKVDGIFASTRDKNSLAMYQDIHVMIFIGFGFLMAFLKRYGQSSIGLTFLLGAFFIQLALFSEGFYVLNSKGIARLTLDLFVAAETALAAILISFGVVIGKTSFFQLIIMGCVEVAAYSFNRHICLRIFKILDTGGSIVVHMFGAYFGLAASFVFFSWRVKRAHYSRLNSSYNSDIFAMLGTLILWLYWPTFNSLGLTLDLQMRAVMNTILAISTSCVISFSCSLLATRKHTFLMTHVQNSTLAGGVAIGSVAGLIVGPFAAAAIGAIAGFVSVMGYVYVSPYLQNKFYIHDTCGVHNLHGMPALISALFSIYFAYVAHIDNYQYSLYELYPARAPRDGQSLNRIQVAYHLHIPPGIERSAGTQALYQLAAIPVTIVIAIVTGLAAGALMCLPMFGQIEDNMLFEDEIIFNLPDGARDPEIERLQRAFKAQEERDREIERSRTERQKRAQRVQEREQASEGLQPEERSETTAM